MFLANITPFQLSWRVANSRHLEGPPMLKAKISNQLTLVRKKLHYSRVSQRSHVLVRSQVPPRPKRTNQNCPSVFEVLTSGRHHSLLPQKLFEAALPPPTFPGGRCLFAPERMWLTFPERFLGGGGAQNQPKSLKSCSGFLRSLVPTFEPEWKQPRSACSDLSKSLS